MGEGAVGGETLPCADFGAGTQAPGSQPQLCLGLGVQPWVSHGFFLCFSPSLTNEVGPGDAEGLHLCLSGQSERCPQDQLASLQPPSLPQPVSWASTSRPPGTSSVPAALPTATLRPLPPRPAAVTSATTAQPWTHHLQPAPVSTIPGPQNPWTPGILRGHLHMSGHL